MQAEIFFFWLFFKKLFQNDYLFFFLQSNDTHFQFSPFQFQVVILQNVKKNSCRVSAYARLCNSGRL